jgi:nicotinate-nucleotide pyrophosphorylase (carboxylating)
MLEKNKNISIPHETIQKMVKIAIEEDLGGKHDITAVLIPESKLAKAHVITREKMILCGQAWVNEVFCEIDTTIAIDWQFKDGDLIQANQVIFKLTGPARSLLTSERTALNFLQVLSATATITYQLVEQLKGAKAKLLDTRKTIPGLRAAQKYAVRCGGGYNHRMGLYDAFLIKENHIAACGSISQAIFRAKKMSPNKTVEIEVENLAQLEEAIAAKPDMIMLDNFSVDNMQQAVAINHGRVKLEASGNVNLNNIKDIAATGIDFISAGILTKNIQAIDLSMRIIA